MVGTSIASERFALLCSHVDPLFRSHLMAASVLAFFTLVQATHLSLPASSDWLQRYRLVTRWLSALSFQVFWGWISTLRQCSHALWTFSFGKVAFCTQRAG